MTGACNNCVRIEQGFGLAYTDFVELSETIYHRVASPWNRMHMSEAKFEDIVGFVMTKDPITVDSRTPVRAALQEMIEHDIGSLIVVNGESVRQEPVGIITERDVTRRSLTPAKENTIYTMPVGDLMSQPLITVAPTTPVWDALEIMMTKKIRRLPVVDNNLIGIVTERDLFKWVLRTAYQPNIPDRLRKFLQ